MIEVKEKDCNNRGFNKHLDLYFNSMKIKNLVWRVCTALVLAFAFGINTYTALFIAPIPIIIIEVILYRKPSLLKIETINSIRRYYDSIDNDGGKHDYFLCNVRKFDGPTFGALHICDERIIFKPFKSNLQDEAFNIGLMGQNSVKVKRILIKRSLIDHILFKELTKGICISYNNKKLLMNTSDDEEVLKLLHRLSFD